MPKSESKQVALKGSWRTLGNKKTDSKRIFKLSQKSAKRVYNSRARKPFSSQRILKSRMLIKLNKDGKKVIYLRSKRATLADLRKVSKNILQRTADGKIPQKWVRRPDLYDMVGIDAPAYAKVSQKHKPKKGSYPRWVDNSGLFAARKKRKSKSKSAKKQ